MVRIAVFDSGLGSLSIIRAIQGLTRAEIIYFADQLGFPYGEKSRLELDRLIRKTIKRLREEFEPDMLVMASNTPSLVLGHIDGLVGVRPPVRQAARASRTGNIAILGTRTAIGSRGLTEYTSQQALPSGTRVHKINATSLVELVESGRFLTEQDRCMAVINDLLRDRFNDCRIDAATLSSTHLSFLGPMLETEFPDVAFLDPAEIVASEIASNIKKPDARNSLRVYASGNAAEFEAKLARVGLDSRVGQLSL